MALDFAPLAVFFYDPLQWSDGIFSTVIINGDIAVFQPCEGSIQQRLYLHKTLFISFFRSQFCQQIFFVVNFVTEIYCLCCNRSIICRFVLWQSFHFIKSELLSRYPHCRIHHNYIQKYSEFPASQAVQVQ